MTGLENALLFIVLGALALYFIIKSFGD